MPIKKQTIVVPFADVQGKGGLTKFIDVDDGNREVPSNMNFESEGFLIKDTGIDAFGGNGVSIIRRLWNFKQKNQTSYFLNLDGQKLRRRDPTTNNLVALQTESAAQPGTTATTAPTGGTGTVTAIGTALVGTGSSFTTQLTANVSYVTVGGFSRLVTAIADNTHATLATAYDVDVTTTTVFTISSQIIVGSSTTFTTTLQVGQVIRVGSEIFYVLIITDDTHIVVSKAPAATASGLSYFKDSEYLFDATAKMGFQEYNNVLYFGNGVDPFATFDGTRILFFPGLPRGNVYAAFKDSIHIAGVIREPLSAYYSGTGTPTTFPAPNVYQPVGTDRINGLVAYYDSLVVLKRNSIWKVTKVYDPIAVAFLLQLDLVNNNFGCCGIQAYFWVENDIWFFTGTEVRSIGFKDQTFGTLGVNDAVLSNQIKETLKLINQAGLANVITFYSNRRFYLSVPMTSSAFNNQIFVCHLLYSKSWTKYKDRTKTSVSDFVVVDGIIYSASGDVAGKMYKWSSTYNDLGLGYLCYVRFRRYEDKDFSQRKIWRYFDLQFKNLESSCIATVYADDFDARTSKGKTFFIGTSVEGQDNALGEVDAGEELIADAFGEDVSAADFIGRRVSFLSKSQSLALMLSNSTANETFSIAQYILEGYLQPRRQYANAKIITLK